MAGATHDPLSSPAACLSRCVACRVSLDGGLTCPVCGYRPLVLDGILVAIGPLTGRNLVAATFDAVFTVGGINYFRDPCAALREMRRVARPGAAIVAADELPDLYRFAPGHALGLEALDKLGLRVMGVDRDFINMVYETPGHVE